MKALEYRPFPPPMHEDSEARRWEPPDPSFDGFFQHRLPAIRYLHVYARKGPEMMALAQRKSDIAARTFPFVGIGAVSYAGMRTTASRIFTIITMPAGMHPIFRWNTGFVNAFVGYEIKSRTPEIALIVKPNHMTG